MTKTDAQARIAAIMSLNSHDHMVAARKDRNLAENTREALERNREACEALGLLDGYLAACGTMNVDGA